MDTTENIKRSALQSLSVINPKFFNVAYLFAHPDVYQAELAESFGMKAATYSKFIDRESSSFSDDQIDIAYQLIRDDLPAIGHFLLLARYLDWTQRDIRLVRARENFSAIVGRFLEEEYPGVDFVFHDDGQSHIAMCFRAADRSQAVVFILAAAHDTIDEAVAEYETAREIRIGFSGSDYTPKTKYIAVSDHPEQFEPFMVNYHADGCVTSIVQVSHDYSTIQGCL